VLLAISAMSDYTSLAIAHYTQQQENLRHECVLPRPVVAIAECDGVVSCGLFDVT
jgi:hypothetical protein